MFWISLASREFLPRVSNMHIVQFLQARHFGCRVCVIWSMSLSTVSCFQKSVSMVLFLIRRHCEWQTVSFSPSSLQLLKTVGGGVISILPLWFVLHQSETVISIPLGAMLSVPMLLLMDSKFLPRPDIIYPWSWTSL